MLSYLKVSFLFTSILNPINFYENPNVHRVTNKKNTEETAAVTHTIS